MMRFEYDPKFISIDKVEPKYKLIGWMMSHKKGWWLVIGCSLMQIIEEQGD